MFSRWKGQDLEKKLERPYVHLLFGARQTGKSTLLQALLPHARLSINLSDPRERSRYLPNPSRLIDDCRSLPAKEKGQVVFIDEVQTVPELFDAVQYLFDSDRQRWRFVLCGSSACKIRTTGANLLPGRSLLHSLHPLTLTEYPPTEPRTPYAQSPLPLPWIRPATDLRPFPASDLVTRLTYGELPGMVLAPPEDRSDLLKSYAALHLEEEVRREALLRNWGGFARFVRLAAAESGTILNFAAIAREAGISEPTVKSYYQLLEDMFIGFRVHAFSGSPRKNLLSTPKFLFFDLGVRHGAAGLLVSPAIVEADPGRYFEQWVGHQLWRRLQYLGEGELFYLRTRDGAEIDYVIRQRGHVIPIEVKWTENPALSDARHLLTFMGEFPKQASQGFIICRLKRPSQLHPSITALPWQDL